MSRIDQRDSLENGVWLGLLAGVASLYARVAAVCDDSECPVYVVYSPWITLVPAGLVGGTFIDLAHRRTLYVRPPRRTTGLSSLQATPLIGQRGGGVALSMSF